MTTYRSQLAQAAADRIAGRLHSRPVSLLKPVSLAKRVTPNADTLARSTRKA